MRSIFFKPEFQEFLKSWPKTMANVDKSDDVTFISIKNPSTFFNSFHDETMNILEEMSHLTEESFGKKFANEDVDGFSNHVLNVERLIICYDEHCNILGFLSYNNPSYGLYVHSVDTSLVHHKNGISKKMIANAIKETRSNFIALTTQNPRVYKALQSFCVYTFPNHLNQNSGGMTDYFASLAKQELVKRPGEFNPVNFIIKNLYDECLYPKIPEASNVFIDNWFMGKINADNSRTSKDGMFIVGLIDGRWRE